MYDLDLVLNPSSGGVHLEKIGRSTAGVATVPMNAIQSRRFAAKIRPLTDAIDDALKDIGASRISWADNGWRVQALRHCSLFNRGERMWVEVFEDGEVVVRSNCINRTQILGGAVNVRNCEELLAAITDRLVDTES